MIGQLFLFHPGLFSDSHLPYHLERDSHDSGPDGVPTLAQMTEAALGVLNKSEYGFFLLVGSLFSRQILSS